MGFSASGELIWGIPVQAYDEDGEPTPFWDEDNDDWRTFEGELEVRSYGHFENPDGPRGILTSTRVEPIRGDCWDPQRVSRGDLVNEVTHDKLYSKSNDQARASGLDVSFYGDGDWYLVASYG